MSRWHSYLNSAKEILSLYKGEEPFASFGKRYFARYKKFGSADRKRIFHLCYSYFRLGKSLQDRLVAEKIVAGLFLCSTEPNDLLKMLQPEWNEKTQLAVQDKMAIIDPGPVIETIFPWVNELSPGMDSLLFILSHLKQPNLFLRLRPGKEAIVLQKLQEAGIEFRILSNSCLALPNSSRITELVELDKEALVQDLNSQQVGRFLKMAIANSQSPIKAWDCCSGSGGKSIMLYDLSPAIELKVSDKRESIIANLKKRFKMAGIRKYTSFIADLTDNQSPIPQSQFQLIIADVPCSGSGTWSRTPEQLMYFNANRIGEFATLQKKIVSRVIPCLQPGGFLLYITCSVFQKENQQVAAFIQEEFHLQPVAMELLEGYDKKADTMFAALFRQSS